MGAVEGREGFRLDPPLSLCPPSAKACNSVGLNRSTETRGEPPPFPPFLLRHTTAPLLRRRLVIPPERGGALIHIWGQLAHSLLTLDPTLASGVGGRKVGKEGLQAATAPIARLAGMAWGGSGRTDVGPSVQMWPAEGRRDQLSRPFCSL